MSGKTCGTCALKVSYYCNVTTWAVEDDDECSVPPEFGGMSWKPRKTCGTCYRERADSVEQVALDMLEEIFEWDARHPDERPDARDERRMYASRLSALGVTP